MNLSRIIAHIPDLRRYLLTSFRVGMAFVGILQCWQIFFTTSLPMELDPYMPYSWRRANVVLLLTVGIGLIAWRKLEDRARDMGLSLVLMAVMFATAQRLSLVDAGYTINGWWWIPVDALAGWAILRFSQNFPTSYSRRHIDVFSAYSVNVFLAVGLIHVLGSFLANKVLPNQSYLTSFMLIGYILAMALIYAKSRVAPIKNRKQGHLFLVGMLLAFVPVLIFSIVTALSPDVAAYFEQPLARSIMVPVVQMLTVFALGVVIYSIFVDRLFLLEKNSNPSRFRISVGYLLLLIAFILIPIALLYIAANASDQAFSDFALSPIGVGMSISIGVTLMIGALAPRMLVLFKQEMVLDEDSQRRNLLGVFSSVSKSRSFTACMSLLKIELQEALAPHTLFMYLPTEKGDYWSDTYGRGESILRDRLRGKQLSESIGKYLDLSNDSLVNSNENWDYLQNVGVQLLIPIQLKSGIGFLAIGKKKHSYKREIAESLTNLLLYCARTHEPVIAGNDYSVSASHGLLICSACHSIESQIADCCSVCGKGFLELRIPRILASKYRTQRVIAVGGQALVYLAFDSLLDRDVAVKVWSKEVGIEASGLLHEARISAQIENEHIAKVHSVETWNGRFFSIMEYMQNGTVRDQLDSGHFDLTQTHQIALDVCSALQATHDEGYVHGDVKPSNIGLDLNLSAKLLDFGAASLTSTTRQQGFAGSLPYLSPELILGGNPQFRDDLWALAVCLYECATRENPFRKTTVAATRKSIISGLVLDPRMVSAKISPGLANALLRSLSKDHWKRPQSAEEFAELVLK